MLIKIKIKGMFVTTVMGLFAAAVLAQPMGLSATRDDNPNRVQHSKYSPYGGSSYDNSYNGYRYWSDRYRSQSYRFFYPPHVHRSFVVAFPYGYYPGVYPYYYPPYYGQGYYGQYTQNEQGQYPQYAQPPQMTREEVQQAVQAEVTRQMDNISQAFITDNYNRAVVRAQGAVKQMPDNTVLRFVYSQALFADGRYQNAAITLRSTLDKMALIGKTDVFYPMSLYPDQDTLNKQIDKLAAAVNIAPRSANLKLLLGYQLLGVGRIDEALDYLQKAAQDSVNEKSALFLVKVSGKIHKDIEPQMAAVKVEQKAVPQQGSGPNEPNTPSVKAPHTEPNY